MCGQRCKFIYIVRTKSGLKADKVIMENLDSELIQFSVRIPSWLDEQLQKEAKSQERTKNNQVTFILKERYSDNKKNEETPTTV